ncbi:helix-turn-helix transcriptional regulator [Streptomyces sp. HNM0645]|uniref:helix-turn-helix domain-containing protein n=1 Tax=Streptomyces sp. HNM0645 TaxID=2782343 RepID=UPI0024B7DB8C|nr:helix-turn-helix transcriptional regulator [Streptomyces sp. HNM0645]MDI9888663.1 helix-turn-helix transcriptional regulator [Streptomyces sp. HNM0645]
MAMTDTGGAATHATEPEASDSLRTFGAVVQALREHAGLSRGDFAPLVGYSKHTVASIELGRRMPDDDFVERAEAALGNTGALRRAARHLSRRPGLAAWFRRWARLEAVASSLYTYECRLIPGLLQTEAYAHLFLRRTGGAAVTRELVDHILDLAEQRNIELQIMPLVRESHAGLGGPMQLLETPDNKWFGYCEGQESGQFVSDAKVVSMLQMRYARMRSQALTLEDSLSLLRRMRGA